MLSKIAFLDAWDLRTSELDRPILPSPSPSGPSNSGIRGKQVLYDRPKTFAGGNAEVVTPQRPAIDNILMFGALTGYSGSDKYIISKNLKSTNLNLAVLAEKIPQTSNYAVSERSNLSHLSSPLVLVPKPGNKWRTRSTTPSIGLLSFCASAVQFGFVQIRMKEGVQTPYSSTRPRGRPMVA
jgi:hypothetical protein